MEYRSAAERQFDQLVAWRRDFHMFPELGFQERRTAQIIADQLRKWDYRVQTGVATTGVVGVLEGTQPGPVVMARFDMDALPITEENRTGYASQNSGVMHACGHDAHMAIGLGVALLMAEHRENLSGVLKLVFQPGEEGSNGAEAMVNEGVLEHPRPDVVLAAHVWSGAPVGVVDVTAGPVMAAVDRWTCTIRGEGGHGAMPHQTVDPIVASAQMVSALQTIVSRNVSPLDTAVVTVGTIHGGNAFNVIPGHVELSGTIRTFSPSVREMVVQRVREVVEGAAASSGTSAELEINFLSPAVVNDERVAAHVHAAAEAVLGSEHVFAGLQTMGGEDASYFLTEIPGCCFFLGSAGTGAGPIAPHHNPHFDVDEKVLPLGVAVMARAIAGYLLENAV